MDLFKFIHLVGRNIKLLVAVPIACAILMFFLTKNQPKKYTSSTVIFTAIASSTSLNNLDESRVDFFATKTSYSNMISVISSKDVLEETSLRLLAHHLMLDRPSYSELSERSFKNLHEITPPEVMALVDKSSEEKTYRNLKNYQKEDKNNFIYGLLYFDHPHYSIKALSKIKTEQIGASDMIQISYEQDDPAVAYQTLNILTKAFLGRYSDLKKNQTNAVVEYFERQLNKAYHELNLAEDTLLLFNRRNSIINYYEQTKQVTTQQEKIDVKQQDVLMDYKSAIAALDRLEKESQTRFKINLRTNQLMDLRHKLININQEIAKIELFESDSVKYSGKTRKLYVSKKEVEDAIKEKIDSLNIYKHNSDGIAQDVILDQWLKTVVDYEESKAKLDAMNQKTKEFSKMFGLYAPLGAMLARIEREIGVKEKAYLEILHHLGLAKLKQQNEELMSNMKVMDSPKLPIDPEPSKRKMIIIVVAFIGFIFTLLGILIIELLDKSIKTAKRFTNQTGIKVMGIDVLNKKYKKIDIRSLIKKGLKKVVEEIIETIHSNPTGKPIVVQIFSNRKGEGKTHIIDSLASQLKGLGIKTLILELNGTSSTSEDKVVVPTKETLMAKSYLEIVPDASKYEVVLVEIPALFNTILNTTLYQTANLSYLVADAGRIWTDADEVMTEKLKNDAQLHLKGILNKVQPDNMDDFLDEIPKKRSRLRRFIKYKLLRKLL